MFQLFSINTNLGSKLKEILIFGFVITVAIVVFAICCVVIMLEYLDVPLPKRIEHFLTVVDKQVVHLNNKLTGENK